MQLEAASSFFAKMEEYELANRFLTCIAESEEAEAQQHSQILSTEVSFCITLWSSWPQNVAIKRKSTSTLGCRT